MRNAQGGFVTQHWNLDALPDVHLDLLHTLMEAATWHRDLQIGVGPATGMERLVVKMGTS